MIGLVAEPFFQVPWSYLLLVLAVSLSFIYMHSRMSGLGARREMPVFLKGVVSVFVLALVSLSTTIMLKYASYLKIDVMHLSSFEFFAVSVIACIFIADKALLSDGKGWSFSRYVGRIPYMFRQAGLYAIMVSVVYYFNPEASLSYTLLAVIPVNVAYHLFYVGLLGWSLKHLLKLFDRVGSFFDSLGHGRDSGHKVKGVAGK